MIDIHTHTVYSDGADTPEQVLCRAAELGLTHLSITDHNSVGAYRDPVMAHWRDLFPGILIRGIEITCMLEGEIVEVLGYGFELEKMEALLPGLVLPFREKQLREARLIEAAFDRAGVIYDKTAVTFDPDRESSRKAFLRELVKEPENLKLLSDPRSAGKSSLFTRQEIYNPQSPLYVDESSLYPTVEGAVKAIHNCGGIALMAHLYIYAHARDFRAKLPEIIEEKGLDGMECAHSEFSPEQISDLEEFCRGRGLLMSGGSDYHGDRKPGVALGTGRGQLAIGEDYLESWPRRIKDTFLS
ncbi:MAG: PHP domain-containing protein [Oscillospiraceae bacterium]|nr:PHP domain-containing protein [Oscillospiraceae bacterium]